MNWFKKKVTEMLKLPADRKSETSFLLITAAGVLEDVLFWRKTWLSLYFIFLFNLVFFVCVYYEVNLVHFIFCFTATILIMDSFEAWLKYKHRTVFLKRVAASATSTRLNNIRLQINDWLRGRYNEFLHLRDTNHTKAFLLVNIIMGLIYILGVYVNGYLLLYIIIMSVFGMHKWGPAVIKAKNKVQQIADSDGELEGLIPEVSSELEIQLLTVEPEPRQSVEDRQSLDWKPEEPFPDDESGSSSENSSSFVSNLSTKQRVQMLDENVETSDSSEDEYIPLVQQREQLQSTLEVIQPTETWGSAAYNAFRNITGTISNMVTQTSPPESRRKRVSSIDSSDGFEMVDQNDLS